MRVARPTGEYAEQMLVPDGWPEADEDAYYDRAQQYLQVLQRVTDVLGHCRQVQSEIFEDDCWSGSAASAANREVATIIDALLTLQEGLATVITWHRYVARSIIQAKSHIDDNVDGACQQVNALLADTKMTVAERNTAINLVVAAAQQENAGAVIATAEEILESRAWKPPQNALQDLLDQQAPPLPVVPITPTPADPHDHVRPEPDPTAPPDSDPAAPPDSDPAAPHDSDPAAPPEPVVPPVVGPGAPPNAGPDVPPDAPSTGPGAPPSAGPGGAPGAPPGTAPGGPPGAGPGTSTPGTSPGPGRSPVSPPARPGTPTPPAAPGAAPSAPGTPNIPAASAQSGDAGDSDPDAPASSGGRSPGGEPDSSPRVHAMSVSAMPSMPMAPGAAGGGAAGGGGGGVGGGTAASGGAVPGVGAPAGRTAQGKGPGMRPAAATTGTAGREPAARREPTERTPPPEGAAMAVIPVSQARAERDAMAEAATADAARRRGQDRLQLARHIAAALNAPVDDREPDFGFFWVTGLTTDGAIVVANSYGLAYIPEGVKLPEKVYMATADEAIPAAERSRWATYPAMAVQGWAAHHNVKLRAVIATEEQLADSDLGAAKVVLNADDIPDSGEMPGRSRLEVVDPKAAAWLARVRDARLLALLPPAPADVTPQVDNRFKLWLQVMKPMASTDPRRATPHLSAFHTYTTHAQEAVAREAHNAVDPVALRCAVADWLYWKHLTELLHAGLSAASEVT